MLNMHAPRFLDWVLAYVRLFRRFCCRLVLVFLDFSTLRVLRSRLENSRSLCWCCGRGLMLCVHVVVRVNAGIGLNIRVECCSKIQPK